MPAVRTVGHRGAFARLMANLALGTAPFAMLAVLYPGVSATGAVPSLLCLALAGLAAIALASGGAEGAAGVLQVSAIRRCLSSLLLGSSLLAVPWHAQGLPCFLWAAGTGFTVRWILFGLETIDLRAEDRARQPLPCLATHLRRTATIITGALIPALILSGLPGLPLLILSFFLTLFAQWTVVGEAHHALIQQTDS